MQATAILLLGLVSAAPDAHPQAVHPHDSVERTARQFRIQTYESFRSDRETYDQIISLSDQLLTNWRESGMPGECHEEVLGWYENASSAFGENLPPLPELPLTEGYWPEGTVDAHDAFPEFGPAFESTQVTPLPVEGSEVELGTASTSADELTISTGLPSSDENATLAERWADSPRAIITLGEFAFGIAGF